MSDSLEPKLTFDTPFEVDRNEGDAACLHGPNGRASGVSGDRDRDSVT